MKEVPNEKTIGVTWFLRTSSNKFLLMKRDEGPPEKQIPYPNHWVFPGGTVEGEESLMDASRREMQEECGYSPPSLQKICSVYYPSNEAEEHFYLVPLTVDIEDLTFNEVADWKLFSLKEIKDLELGFWCEEVLPVLHRFLDEIDGKP
jgi:8-oxo-dGTP pyrophosphatase MutT (NUDIX family)